MLVITNIIYDIIYTNYTRVQASRVAFHYDENKTEFLL